MNPSRAHTDSAADEQAALWAARLDGGNLASADRAALDAWLEQSPRHRTLLSQYCQFSADLEQQLPALVAAGAISPPAAPRRRSFRTGWVAMVLAAAALLAVGLWLHAPSPTEAAATSVAQRKTLKLADGTVVELNARTSVLVALAGHDRHVRLAEGEAFFTVAKDKSRPFIIDTPAGAVRVTGTVFDVHADTAAKLTVTVVEGSVQVTPTTDGAASQPYALTASDQLTARAGAPTTVRRLNQDQLAAALAWRQGDAVFDGTPLATALAQFARYHGQTITAAPSVATLKVGGRYRLDDLDGFLNDIQSFLPVRVSRDESSGAISVLPRTGG